MNNANALIVAVSLTLFSGQAASAQDLSRYRTYVLASSVDVVAKASGMRASDTQTLHQRPATIQELQWRAPYVTTASATADPVRGVVFTFVDDALYQVVVTYDRERMDGLSDGDVIESVSASYGAPVDKKAIARTGLPTIALHGAVVLAQWGDDASLLTLLRDSYSPEFQLILSSKALSTRARGAIREAVRLDVLEAPQRELEQRKKDAAEASATRDKTRSTNKAAFRP